MVDKSPLDYSQLLADVQANIDAVASPVQTAVYLEYDHDGGNGILDSYNVASVTRVSEGRFTITFTEDVPGGYVVSVTTNQNAARPIGLWTLDNRTDSGFDLVIWDNVAGNQQPTDPAAFFVEVADKTGGGSAPTPTIDTGDPNYVLLTYNGSSVSGGGLTFTSSNNGDTLEFISTSGGSVLPGNTAVHVGGSQVASIDIQVQFIGRQFSVTIGGTNYGIDQFADGVVNVDA